jgi:hypothetical protein
MSHEDNPDGFPPPDQPTVLPMGADSRDWRMWLKTWGPKLVVGIFLVASLPTFRIIAIEFRYGIDLGSIIGALADLIFSPVPFNAILALVVIQILKLISRTRDTSVVQTPPLPPTHGSAIPPPPGSPAFHANPPTQRQDSKEARQVGCLLFVILGGVLFAFIPILVFLAASPEKDESTSFLPLATIVTLPIGGLIVLVAVVVGFQKSLRNRK